MSLRDVAVYTNDENTRSFIGIKVSSGQDKMINVMKDLNDLLSTYNLPPFYEVCIQFKNRNARVWFGLPMAVNSS